MAAAVVLLHALVSCSGSAASVKLAFWTSVPVCPGGVCSTETNCLNSTLQLVAAQRDNIDRLIVHNGLALTTQGEVVCTDCGVLLPLEANIQSWLPRLRVALGGDAANAEVHLALSIGFDPTTHKYNTTAPGLGR